jgi:hypothetical protein
MDAKLEEFLNTLAEAERAGGQDGRLRRESARGD